MLSLVGAQKVHDACTMYMDIYMCWRVCSCMYFTGDIIVGFASSAQKFPESNDRHDVHTECGEDGKVM